MKPPRPKPVPLPNRRTLIAYIQDGSTAQDLCVCFGMGKREAAALVREAAKGRGKRK